MIKDRKGNILEGDEGQEKVLSFLYNNAFGRVITKLLCRRFISEIGRMYMESSLSKGRIKKLIASHNINMADYEDKKFGSFNEFFIRQLSEGARTVELSPEAVISPADSKLTVYDISKESKYVVKGCEYSINQLLGGDEELASQYYGGKCFIYRLTVDNYHRYCYMDNGKELYNRFIPGVLHTVNPIALKKHDVYGKNCRELTVLETENFDNVAYIEVGAMMVGKINNHHKSEFKRGEEKGYFSFGGSTIIVLYKKDIVQLADDIAANSEKEIETTVLFGEAVGTRK